MRRCVSFLRPQTGLTGKPLSMLVSGAKTARYFVGNASGNSSTKSHTIGLNGIVTDISILLFSNKMIGNRSLNRLER